MPPKVVNRHTAHYCFIHSIILRHLFSRPTYLFLCLYALFWMLFNIYVYMNKTFLLYISIITQWSQTHSVKVLSTFPRYFLNKTVPKRSHLFPQCIMVDMYHVLVSILLKQTHRDSLTIRILETRM